MEDPDPIKPGTLGTVTDYCYKHSDGEFSWSRKGSIDVGVRWDDGRSLNLLIPVDRWVLIDE